MTTRWTDPKVATLCAAVAAAALLPVVGYDFVRWDDPVYVLDNPLLRGGGSLRAWLLTPNLGYPIPVTALSYRLEVALFGFSAPAMHATNLLLHSLNVAGAFLVGRRLGLRRAGAVFAALLFALHPLVAEPVSWVTGRKELLAAGGSLLATWLALAGRSRGAAVAFLLAVLSKPVAVFLPAFEAARRLAGGEGLRSVARAIRLPAAVAALVVPLSWWGLRGVEGAAPARPITGVLREVWYSLGHGIALVVGLVSPCAVQQPPRVPPAFDPLIDGAPLGAALLVLALLRWPKPARGPFQAGLLWAGLSWLPASNLLPLTRFLADSYLYLPLIGLGWAAGAVVDALSARRPLRPALLVAGIVLGGGLLRGLERSSARWEDSVALWESTARSRPDDPRACRDAGNAWLAAQRPERALERYLGCRERFGGAMFDKNIAITLSALRRYEEARPLLERLAREDPGDATVGKYLRGVREALGR